MWALIATLVIVGLLLLGIELLVIPGFGVVGILGIVSFVCSCYFSFATFGVTAGVAVLIAEIVLVSAFIVLVLRSKTWRKITLNTNIDSKVDELPQNKGIEVGMKGRAITRLAPAGQVEFENAVVEAFCRDTIINGGSIVEVVEIADNRIFVKVENN